MLRPKANNILFGLSWVMIDGVKVAPRVLLSDDGANNSSKHIFVN